MMQDRFYNLGWTPVQDLWNWVEKNLDLEFLCDPY
jgi:hypothetical protein